MVDAGKNDLESSYTDGVKGVIEYLSIFRKQKAGSFAYPRFETLDLSDHQSILILSPHPDDDVIGCGGVIRKAVLSGSKVKVVYLTDGRFGNSSYSEEELVKVRKKEAMSSLEVLGCDDAVFFDNHDMGLKVDEENIGRLHRLLEEFRPNALFVPSFEEMPPDHQITAHIAAHALERHDSELHCFGYEVWVPLIPTTLVDITDVIDKKVEAILQHRSQIAVSDYSVKIRGLNSYRSMYAKKGIDFCEAFAHSNRDDYIQLANSLGVFNYRVKQ